MSGLAVLFALAILMGLASAILYLAVAGYWRRRQRFGVVPDPWWLKALTAGRVTLVTVCRVLGGLFSNEEFNRLLREEPSQHRSAPP